MKFVHSKKEAEGEKMGLDKSKKISLVLGIGILVVLLLGVFLLGATINEGQYGAKKATSQSILVYSPQAKSSSANYLDTTAKKTNLGQTLKEQQYSNAATINNIDIDISVPTSYSYSKPHYYGGYKKYSYGYYKPYYSYGYNKYYNNYYPYKSNGFYYSNSYGSWHKYNSW